MLVVLTRSGPRRAEERNPEDSILFCEAANSCDPCPTSSIDKPNWALHPDVSSWNLSLAQPWHMILNPWCSWETIFSNIYSSRGLMLRLKSEELKFFFNTEF